MRETWYLLEDGRMVDPIEVAPDDAGVLRHASGVAVAMRGQVPHSRGVDDPAAERAKAAAASAAHAGAGAKAKAEAEAKTATGKGKAMKPDDKDPAYKTRETKAH